MTPECWGDSPSPECFMCEKVTEHPLDCLLLQLHLLSKFPSWDVYCSGPRCLWESPASLQSSRHCRAYSHPDLPPGIIDLQSRGSYPLSGLGQTSSCWQGQQTSIKLPLFPESSLPMKSHITPHAKSLCPLPQVPLPYQPSLQQA